MRFTNFAQQDMIVGIKQHEQRGEYFLVKKEGAEEDVISVRHTLIIGGYVGCVGISVFAIVLVAMASQGSQDSKYISEGMQAHCGWSVMVLGTCSFLVFICQLVAGAHMNRHAAVAFSVMQLLGWNIVMGVVDTGWSLHYVGLAMFLIGNVCYHWIASHDENYGGPRYRWMNGLTIMFTATFCCAALAVRYASSRDIERQTKACAVALEFVLFFSGMLENFILLHGLDQYENIHLVFEPKRF